MSRTYPGMPWADPADLRRDGLRRAARSRNAGRYRGSGRHWATPPEVFDPLHAEFAFTLDPCARPETAKVPRYYTEADDGLARSWQGERVFMNPPYGREIATWTAKAAAEAAGSALVVGLVPASTDLEWWHRDVLATEAELRFIRGRVRFLDLDGRRWANAMMPSVVVVWRPRGT
jgi:site-specific DNA-methyltransferase (adenine-specific)